MKQDDSTLLKKYGKDPGFKVPENYFEDFNKKMAAMLPDVEITPVDIKPTMWQRVRPLVYLAAMFAGVWCMMSVFNYFNASSNLGVSVVAEKMGEDQKNVERFFSEVGKLVELSLVSVNFFSVTFSKSKFNFSAEIFSKRFKSPIESTSEILKR